MMLYKSKLRYGTYLSSFNQLIKSKAFEYIEEKLSFNHHNMFHLVGETKDLLRLFHKRVMALEYGRYISPSVSNI